jgi:hypothetical protein
VQGKLLQGRAETGEVEIHIGVCSRTLSMPSSAIGSHSLICMHHA